MSTYSHHLRAARVLLSAGIICALSIPAFAGDGTDKPAPATTPSGDAAQPSQTRAKKVYTNDDVEALRKNYADSTVGNASPDISATPTSQPRNAPRIIATRTVATQQLAPDQDPLWYAQQTASVSSQIASIDEQVQQLRNFSASNAAPGAETPNVNVGLNLYAPADGITTDAQIQLLLQQRAEFDAQLVGLQDRARANGIDPGVLRHAADNPQSVENTRTLTPQQRLAATRNTLDQLQSELTATRDTEAAMHQEAAAQNTKIIPETKFGGGFTADFLKQLNLHQAAVQEQLSTAEDAARKQGVPTGSMP